MHSTPSHKCTILEPVGRILNTNVLVVFVYHTHQSRDPRFPQEAILPETVFRLAKLFPTSHAASGWFPRLRKSQPWVSTPHHPSLHPPCLPASEGPLPKGQASLHLEEYLEKPIRQALPHLNFTYEWGHHSFRLNTG